MVAVLPVIVASGVLGTRESSVPVRTLSVTDWDGAEVPRLFIAVTVILPSASPVPGQG
jgi:hypothetical protein